MIGIESIREAFIASYNFRLALPEAFTQPGDHLIAKYGTYIRINNRGNTIIDGFEFSDSHLTHSIEFRFNRNVAWKFR